MDSVAKRLPEQARRRSGAVESAFLHEPILERLDAEWTFTARWQVESPRSIHHASWGNAVSLADDIRRFQKSLDDLPEPLLKEIRCHPLELPEHTAAPIRAVYKMDPAIAFGIPVFADADVTPGTTVAVMRDGTEKVFVGRIGDLTTNDVNSFTTEADGDA